MEAHAGPTSMTLRKDALQVAAKLTQEIVTCAQRYSSDGRGTVGMVQVHPKSRNVIPGRVSFSIDMRNASDVLVDAMDTDIHIAVARSSAESGLQVKFEQVSAYSAQPFHQDRKQALSLAAEKLGI
jgi:beta-ureidopropionase / N-carbamoyl-L-amino-acid hydrolase